MPPADGKASAFSEGFIARVARGLGYIATGRPQDWFGPLDPMTPIAPPEVAGRQFDYPVGFNLALGPRAYEPVGFPELRALADAYDLIRTIIVSNVIASYDEKETGWAGTFGGAAGLAGGTVQGFGTGDALSISDFLGTPDILHYGGIGSGTYEIPAGHEIDIGRIAPCAVTVTWTSLGEPVGQNVLAIADFLGATDVLGYSASVNTDIYPEIALSQDGSTWSAWQKWAPGSYSARKFKARMQLVTSDPQTIPVLEGFTFAIDVPDRDDHYVGLSVAAGGTTLTFMPDGLATAAPFNGGPNGASTPNIQVTIVNAQAGDLLSLTGVSLSQCTVQVLNGGVGVARTVNVLAQGY